MSVDLHYVAQGIKMVSYSHTLATVMEDTARTSSMEHMVAIPEVGSAAHPKLWKEFLDYYQGYQDHLYLEDSDGDAVIYNRLDGVIYARFFIRHRTVDQQLVLPEDVLNHLVEHWLVRWSKES